MKSRKTIILSLLFILVAAAIFGGQWYSSKRSADNYKLFYNSNINGILDTTYTKQKGSAILVNGQEYIFYPVQSAGSHNERFEATAVTGDAVKKPARADTLTLAHAGKFYKYTFSKPE